MGCFWWALWVICWLAAGWSLWKDLGAAGGSGLAIIFVLVQVFFVRSLSDSRSGDLRGQFLGWLGAGSAGLVGGMVGVVAIRSVLFFRGSWELPLTALGWILGVMVLGVVHVLVLRRPEGRARGEALSGLLAAVFMISLTAYLLAKLSLASTQPNWLFRFPGNEAVRELWSRTGWMSFLLLLWAVGGGCLMRVTKTARSGPSHASIQGGGSFGPSAQ